MSAHLLPPCLHTPAHVSRFLKMSEHDAPDSISRSSWGFRGPKLKTFKRRVLFTVSSSKSSCSTSSPPPIERTEARVERRDGNSSILLHVDVVVFVGVVDDIQCCHRNAPRAGGPSFITWLTIVTSPTFTPSTPPEMHSRNKTSHPSVYFNILEGCSSSSYLQH